MDTQIIVDFGLGGNAADMVRRGWSNPEPGFCWMTDLESVVQVPRPAAGGSYYLSLIVRPHIREAKLPKQSLIIAVNDVIVSVVELTQDCMVTCEVPQHAIELADPIAIRLLHPHAASPREVAEVPDDRLLAIAVERLIIRSIVPATVPDLGRPTGAAPAPGKSGSRLEHASSPRVGSSTDVQVDERRRG